MIFNELSLKGAYLIELESFKDERGSFTRQFCHKEFKEAVEKGDFVKMSQLKEQGYQPSKELIQSLNETASGNTMIAVQKIFNLKGSANTLGDVKLAQGQQSAEKDLKRPLANTVNKMFSDL